MQAKLLEGLIHQLQERHYHHRQGYSLPGSGVRYAIKYIPHIGCRNRTP